MYGDERRPTLARPQNVELKRDIELAAWRLFRERGYDATSYTAVAEVCGISRNLAQYHYPKKEMLAIAFMERVLEESQRALAITPNQLQGNFALMRATGACYFEFLLQEGGYSEFLLDVLRSRDLTENILTFNTRWAMDRIDSLSREHEDTAPLRAVIVQMGGFYELLYHCLKEGEPIDPYAELRPVMVAFMGSLGYTDQQTTTALSGSAPSRKRIASVVAAMNAAMPV